MKQVEYIIVGNGLAGVAFCEQLRLHNKDFLVFSDLSQQSSKVAAGLYNPVVLKRFTKAWKAKFLLEKAIPKYKELEDLLNVELDYQIPVYRRFSSIEEQNDWFTASDKPVLCDFLSTNLIKNKNPSIDAKFGFGEVLSSGRINTTLLIPSYSDYLKKEDKLISETFEYDQLRIQKNRVEYKGISSKYIVFAEGFGIQRNPYFNALPLNGTKGEMLVVKAPDLKMNFILKSSVFVVPLENDLYWIGGTYEREDKTNNITTKGKEELLQKVNNILNCEFEVVRQMSGIRPTTKDRRPLVGSHYIYKNLCVLNGLGTRGVMIAPFVAEQLYNYIEHNAELDEEIDIKRCY